METLIRGCRALLPEEDGLAMRDRDIVVRDGAIAEIVTANSATATPEATILEGADRLVVPGLVNAHTHSPSNMLRGTADGMDHVGFMWMNQADNFGRSDEEIAIAATLGALDMLRSGVTSAIDHYPEQNCTVEAVAPVARAYADIGMRAAIALRVFDMGYDDIDPAQFEGLDAEIPTDNPLTPLPADEIDAMCRAVIAAWHGHDGLISIFPGPSNPIRCSDDLLVRCHRIAVEHDLGVHAHLLETRIQQTLAADRYGRSMVAQMAALGTLDRRWSFAHTVWVDDADIALLAKHRAVVVHNPHSNSKIGAGVAPVAKMLKAGVPVALGTDGASTNDTLGLHEAMTLACLLPRVTGVEKADWPGPEAAIGLATTGGAAAMNMAGKLGAIAPGMRADLVLYDLNTPSFAPLNDPLQHLVFSERGRSVATVMVDGVVVYQDGRYASADADAAIAEALAMRKSQLGRNQGLYRFAQALVRAQEDATAAH